MKASLRLLMTAALLPAAAALADTGIYSCVDAHGRTLTSDRPIAVCNDRRQRQLGHSGATLRIIEPEPTAMEREAALESQRQRTQQQQRKREHLRESAQRDRALLIRYPDRATHESARRHALEQVDQAIAAAGSHVTSLARERRKLDSELEFYDNNPDHAPAELRRTMARNAEATDMALRLIASQEAERDRIDARYAEEAAHLETLWRAQGAQASEAAGAN